MLSQTGDSLAELFGSDLHEADLATVDAPSPVTQKWGKALDGGFQILPDLILRHQRELKLSSNDIVVLLHLLMAWWRKERAPFPRTSTIARRMDTSERTVQRALDRLRKNKLLVKLPKKASDADARQAYDLTPLATRLEQIAETDPIAERRRSLRAGGAGVHTQPPAQA